MIRDYQAIQSTWFLKGRQRLIKTYGKHEGVKLMGILDYETGYIYCEEHQKYDAEAFLKYIKKIIEIYPTGKIVMILDNAKIHHAKLIKPYLESMKSRLELVFLPSYSPELNLIEGLWKWMKSEVINNHFFSNVKQIAKAVKSFISWISNMSETVIDRLCVRM
jgi:putative transposase